MIRVETVRRDDEPGQPEHVLDPPVEVVVTVDGQRWPGTAERWRGRWVFCRWSREAGMTYMGWVLGEDVERLPA